VDEKNLLAILGFVIAFFIIGESVSAKEVNNEFNLTKQEIKILLKDVGMTQSEIDEMPVDFLRSLIADGAKKVFYKKERVAVNDNKSRNDGVSALTNGELNGHVDITGSAYAVTSDWSGYRKFRFWGRWSWVSIPQNTYEDKFAIGWPSSEGIILRTNTSGGIQLHTHDYWTGAARRDYGTQPDRAEPNAGVGVNIDLIQGQGKNHAGHIDQYVYTRQSSGDANVKFEYGHARTAFSPSWTLNSATGLGVSATLTVDTGYVMQTISW
jgi:hypothetical protein